MFKKILIANRGEIAVRIIRACKEMGIKSVAVYSQVDDKALHKKLADEAICIGGAKPADSYLNMERIIQTALLTGCDAIHPGFGFLSENPKFARMVEKCGLVFIGPNADVMEKMGCKSEAIKMMMEAGVPVVPGSHKAVEYDEAIKIAKEIGFPVLIKASYGGGGKGIRLVRKEEDFKDLYFEAKDEAKRFFSNDEIYDHKLATVCNRYAIYFDGAHRSSADALACGLLFVKMLIQRIDGCYKIDDLLQKAYEK